MDCIYPTNSPWNNNGNPGEVSPSQLTKECVRDISAAGFNSL